MVTIKSGPTPPSATTTRAASAAGPAGAWGWLGRPAVQRVLSVLVVLGLWQLIGSHYQYSMSSPSAIVDGARSSLFSEVFPAFGQTLLSFALGFAISVVVGVPVGIAMARVRFIRTAIEPYVLMLYSMPMLALIPVLIIVFGISFELRVTGVVLFGIFAIIVNTFTGASRVDPAYEDVGRAFVASPWKRLTSIIFPGSLRYIFAGVRIGFGHGMIGAVVIEIEASAVGMGNLLTQYIQALQLGKFFVVVIVLGIFSIICTLLLRAAERWATEPWQRRRHLPDAWRDRLDPGRIVPAGLGPQLRTAERAASAALRPAARGLAALARSKGGAWLIRLVVLALIIGVWQIESDHVSQAVLAAPGSVASAVYQLSVVHHQIWGPLLNSVELLFAGWAVAVALGVPLGLLMGRFRWFENITDPYVSFLYALPHVCFVPLMVVWLGFGFKFGLAYVVLSAIFPVIINTMQGVKSIDPEYIAAGRSFCASERTIMRAIVIPGATPFMVAGARLAFSVSWIGVIVSEVLSSQTGLGGMIDTFSNNYQTADMFVPVLFIAAISVIILQVSTRYQKRLTPWASVGL
jgi:NitT/TauT family transport system permease protein